MTYLKIHPEGLLGKDIEIAFLEKRKARKAAQKAVKTKNEIIKKYIHLLRPLKKQNIKEIKVMSDEMTDLLKEGLQETYDGLFEELLVLKAELIEGAKVIEEHELTQDYLDSYKEFIREVEDDILNVFRKYLNELIDATSGKEMAESALSIALDKYKLKGLFSPLRPMLEWLSERKLAKETFKLEARLEKLEKRKKFTQKDIEELIHIEKKFIIDLKKIIKDLCIYALLIIKSGHKFYAVMETEAKKAKGDYSASLREYAETANQLLKDEFTALESLNKAKLQLENKFVLGARNVLAKAVLGEITVNKSGIDSEPADGGKRHTQKEWIAYFNKEGEAMISAPDIYQAGKTGSDELIKSLREDFTHHWFVSSTRIKYNSNNLNAKIIHNFDSSAVKQNGFDMNIPVYDETKLSEAIETKEGLAYLQALFDTNDNAGTIMNVLKRLSGKSADDTRLWTSSQDSRKKYSERAVRFYDDSGRFRVDGGNNFGGNYGRSRGVRVNKSQRS